MTSRRPSEKARDRSGHNSDSDQENCHERSLAFPLAIANFKLDPSSAMPIYQQICQAVRTAIWTRELPPGTLLPTSRDLAKHLGVARNTVVFAYSRLVAESLCISNTRRGTRVATDLPSRAHFADMSVEEARTGAPVVLHPAFGARQSLEMRVDRVAGGTPFVLHASDPILYPRTKLGRRLAEKFMRAAPASHFSPSSPNDIVHFQKSIAAYLRQARGVICDPAQVIVVSGLESALNLTARVLLDPGDSVAIVDPAMDVVHSAFSAARVHMQPIPSDAHGADPKRMKGPPVRIMFVSPSVSFPFGVQMPESRRLAILDAAHAQSAIIFENDTFGELRYGGGRVRSLQGLDAEGRVIHYGGFSKTLGAQVNVGYLIVPQSLRDCFAEVGRRVLNAPAPPILDALAEFIDRNEYAMHVGTVRGIYAKRRDLVKHACRTHIPAAGISEPLGGMHIVLHFDIRFDETAVCDAAAADGLPVRPLSRYYLQKSESRGLVFGFGAIPERSIPPMIERLAEILDDPDGAAFRRATA